jgi:hypothetical protein
MRGRKLSNQTTCVAYDGSTSAQKTATSNISLCLEDAINKSTVSSTPKSYPNPISVVQYRVPQPSTSNDYMVQLTTN